MADCGAHWISKQQSTVCFLSLLRYHQTSRAGAQITEICAFHNRTFFIAAIGQSPCIALPCHTWKLRVLANGRPRAAVAFEDRANLDALRLCSPETVIRC